MKFRAMGKRVSKRWLKRHFKFTSLHFQSATWTAKLERVPKIDDDSLFQQYWSLCEPELFPGSRLIGVHGRKGAKINLFNSGKCVCLGKLFRSKNIVEYVLLTLVQNIRL